MVSLEVLEKQLKEEQLHSIYLFYGDEIYLLENTVRKLKNVFGELVEGINYIMIDEESIEHLITNIETPAFGYEKKLILVKNTGIMKRDAKKKNAKVALLKDKIKNYIEKNKTLIEESVVLVFIEQSVDKGTLLTVLEDNNAVICNFEKQKPHQIASRIKSICNAYEVEIEPNTIQYFIECVGTNMQDVINEIRKQIEYVGKKGTITKETIEILTIRQIDSVIFDLTDSLGKRDIEKALQVLKNLIYAKEPIQKILITLYNHFKKLYLTKLASEQKKDILLVLKLKPNQIFLTNKYKSQSNYFSKDELKNILQELIKLDANYKIGLIDISIGLESILCRYCSK